MRARLPSALAAALLLAACGSSRVSITGEVRYGKTAQDDYQAGQEELKDRNFTEATKFFENVRNKYPYSSYAALADLRLADVKYDQEHFVEAAEAYQQFVQLHPRHEQVDYAAFRVALSHWRERPAEHFFTPPSEEKDQAQVRDAVKAVEDFVKKYPDSKYRPDAVKILAEGRGRLAEHEWYVAQFYAKRARWAGAAGRYEALAREFPDTPRAPAALYELAQACLKLEERHRARQALQQLIVKFPQDPRRAEAEKLLASIRG